MADFHEVVWTPERVARIWKFYAGHPAYQNQYFSQHSGRHILRYLQKWGTLKGKTVLDYGCGPGYFLEHLLKEQGLKQCFGLEFSKEAVTQVTEKFKRHPKFGGAVWAEQLPSAFSAGTFDVVVAIEVVEHVSDEFLGALLKEIHRLLKPGGRLIITTPNKEDLPLNTLACPECGCVFHKWQHVRRWEAETLARTLKSYGFKVKACEGTFFLPEQARWLFKLKKFLKPKLQYPHLICCAEKEQ